MQENGPTVSIFTDVSNEAGNLGFLNEISQFKNKYQL